MSKTESEHQELAWVIHKLREHRNRVPNYLHQKFDQAVSLLSEVEAALGLGNREAASAEHLTFSGKIIGVLHKMTEFENRFRTLLLGHYYYNCLQAFPKFAVEAAAKFRLDPVAIVNAAERIMDNDSDFSIVKIHDNYTASLNNYPGIMFERYYKLDNRNALIEIATKSFEEIVRDYGSVDAAYQTAKSRIEKGSQFFLGRVLPDVRHVADIRTLFFYEYKRQERIFDHGTDEEKIAYSLLANAVFRCFEVLVAGQRI